MAQPARTTDYVARHTTFGWWAIFGFIILGLVLDYFHAFRVGWYLDADNETRRLMGTLAHAHGTLLGVLNVVYAFTYHMRSELLLKSSRIASPCLLSSSILIPFGFLAGGLFTLGSEPGIAIFLVPVGGALLLTGVGVTALALRGAKA